MSTTRTVLQPPAPGGLEKLARGAALAASRLADGVAALALFALMALSFVDVFGRELFNKPLPGTVEITELLMATLIFSVLPGISRRGEHVAVDLLDPYVPAWLRPIQRMVANGLGAAVFGVIGWQLHDEARKLARYGGTTPYFEWSLAPFVDLMAIMAALAALGFLAAMFVRPQEAR